MANIETFEKHAEQYEAWFERNRFAYESELRAAKILMPESGNGVEIGVGSGRFAAPFGIKLGVEPSAAISPLARQKGIEVIDGVAESLPFTNARFDFALMVTTICFVDNAEMAIKKAYRVLKTGGYLIIGLIDKESPLTEIKEIEPAKEGHGEGSLAVIRAVK
jgi:SAM-dependent methyltransferase